MYLDEQIYLCKLGYRSNQKRNGAIIVNGSFQQNLYDNI